MNIKISDIIKICNAKLVFGDENIVCENFSKDTRTIESGDIYVGIKGENFDGNSLYKEAFEKGAKVCILQGVHINDIEKISNKAVLLVEDTIQALQQIAKYKREQYNIPVVAVTGSVGKTSTKDLVASVMSRKYNVLKTEGNLNNHIGLPLTILKLKNHDALVVEMGMNNLGEIEVLTKIAQPTIAVITNIGTAHIGNLGSRENILKAKLEILKGLSADGKIVINNDNDLLNKWSIENKIKNQIVTYGIENESDIKAENIQMFQNRSVFEVEQNKIEIAVGGEVFILNSLAAITVGKLLGISIDKICEGIANFELSNNRMEMIETKEGVTIINDSYNANFDSMKAALQMLGKSGKRKIAVLGDMLELGEFSEKLHMEVGKEVGKNNVDILIIVGGFANSIKEGAIAQNFEKENIIICLNNDEAIKLVNKIKKENDCILVKASNGMNFKEIVEGIK